MTNRFLRITIKLPEDYDDVHPDLCISDMNIHPAFEIMEIEEVEPLHNDGWNIVEG